MKLVEFVTAANAPAVDATTISLSLADHDRLAPGWDDKAQRAILPVGNEAAGGLKSTTDDMLRYPLADRGDRSRSQALSRAGLDGERSSVRRSGYVRHRF